MTVPRLSVLVNPQNKPQTSLNFGLEDFLTRASKDWQGDGNGPPPATVSIGSADVPRSLLDEGMIEMMRYQTLGMVSEMLVNLQEFQMLVDPPAPVEGVDKNPQALREVDNSFRHGLRVFFNSAAPSERRFHFLGVPSAPSSAASVYLPKGTDTIGFADVDMSDVSTQKLLHGLRLACVRIGEFATAFAGNVCFGTPAYLVAAAGIRLEPTSPPITSIE